MKLYSILDRKSHTYGAPMMFDQDEIAKRTLKIALSENGLGKTIALYPEDFEVYCLGEFDQETGEVLPDIKFVTNVADLKEKQNV